jgi:YD repeat-containing protein
VGTLDADALAGIGGHTNPTDCTLNAVAYTACAGHDALYGSLLAKVTNVLGQQANLNYTTDGANTNSPDASNGWGQWLTTSADPNGQTSAYGYDALGRLTAMALPGDTLSSSPTTSYQYVITCAATGAAYPCAALVTTQRLASGVTVASATYYDGWGRPVETVTPAFDSGNPLVITYTISYTLYDPAGRKVFVSDPYFTTHDWTGSVGTPPYFPPDGTVVGTSATYDGLGRTLTTKDQLQPQPPRPIASSSRRAPTSMATRASTPRRAWWTLTATRRSRSPTGWAASCIPR